MTELKFRVWDGIEMESFTLDNDFDCIVGWLENRIIMQYTGLKDMHGKEIYVGDKLEWKHAEQGKEDLFHKQSGIVGLHNGSFGCFGNPFHEWSTDDEGVLTENKYVTSGCIVGSDLYYIMFDIEIIGHIYEDKQLKK